MSDINLILYFIEYTTVRSPSEFCNNIESPALPLPVDENRNILFHLIVQDPNIQLDPNDQFAPSSDAGKSILDFDLNQIPPDEDE